MLAMMIMLLAMMAILLAQPILVAEIRAAEDNSHICVVHRNGSASIFWRRLVKSYLKMEVEWASNLWIHPGVWGGEGLCPSWLCTGCNHALGACPRLEGLTREG